MQCASKNCLSEVDPMSIPESRTELLDYVRSTFHKLKLELDAAGPQSDRLRKLNTQEGAGSR